jgi:Amt family ammonium transporter
LSVIGGVTALLATLVLGPRRGRFYDAQGEPLEIPKPFPGHSVALQMLGTMILWFGCKFNSLFTFSVILTSNFRSLRSLIGLNHNTGTTIYRFSIQREKGLDSTLDRLWF